MTRTEFRKSMTSDARKKSILTLMLEEKIRAELNKDEADELV